MTARVLIVDDSLTVRMDLAESFREAGFDAQPCGTVTEARAILRDGTPHVCVLDVQLPDGDGVSLVEEIRRSPNGESIVIVMLSAETSAEDRLRGLQTGANEYVGKPYDTGYLVARVRELLADRSGGVSSDETTVLVIDDSVTFRETLREACEDAGYRVVTAPTGEDGLRVAATVLPHAIVVDGELPGIDGTTVIRHVRLDARLRDIPCLLLTASDDRHAELRALDAGADAFVRKQADLDVILARLSASLRQTTTRAVADAHGSALGPKKLLAVDASAAFLNALTDALKGEGYDILQAQSGEQALALLAVQTVDCILLDLSMPGLSGQETCQRIKRAPVVREIPLIILTSVDDPHTMVESLAAGADDYIVKTSTFDAVKARVRAQIRRKQLEDAHRRVREELLHKELEAAEARAARDLAETRAKLVDELERKNTELEAFSYSVSHDLRAPLRSIDGFSKVVLEEYSANLDPKARQYLGHVRASAHRMGQIIDDLLELSRVGRAEITPARVDLAEVARRVIGDLQRRDPDRAVEIVIQDPLIAQCDERLIQIVFENLLSNGWKFTAKTAAPRLTVGSRADEAGIVYFVSDNGAGFDMAYAGKLFRPFQRLHGDREFPGTGIGLTIVQRIVERHGGRIWAEAKPAEGATFTFTLPFPEARRGTEATEHGVRNGRPA